jgi:Glyoxalase-like domain
MKLGHRRRPGRGDRPPDRPSYVQPTWHDPTSSMQMHLDFHVDDLEAAEARVLAAGATKFDFQLAVTP